MQVIKHITLVVCVVGCLGQQPALVAQDPGAAVALKPSSIRLTVVDKDNRLITDLIKMDIRLIADDTVQEITDLTVEKDLPTSVAVLLDSSVSMERLLPLAKRTAQVFISNFVRSARDEAAVISVSDSVTVHQDLTSDLKQAGSAIDKVTLVLPPNYVRGGIVVGRPSTTIGPVRGSTGLWEGLASAAESLQKAKLGSRKAIILFSDGVDTSSQLKLSKAIEQAIRYDAAVFAIGLRDKNFGSDPDSLKKIAERTGGRAFFPGKADELPAILEQISQELRTQYVLSFNSGRGTSQGKPRKLKLEIINPEKKKQKLQLAYKREYFSGN